MKHVVLITLAAIMSTTAMESPLKRYHQDLYLFEISKNPSPKRARVCPDLNSVSKRTLFLNEVPSRESLISLFDHLSGDEQWTSHFSPANKLNKIRQIHTLLDLSNMSNLKVADIESIGALLPTVRSLHLSATQSNSANAPELIQALRRKFPLLKFLNLGVVEKATVDNLFPYAQGKFDIQRDSPPIVRSQRLKG